MTFLLYDDVHTYFRFLIVRCQNISMAIYGCHLGHFVRRNYPREYYWEFWVGLCRQILQMMTLFQTNVILHTRFQTRGNLSEDGLTLSAGLQEWSTSNFSP